MVRRKTELLARSRSDVQALATKGCSGQGASFYPDLEPNPIVTLNLQVLANQRLAAQAAARRTSASREEAERARVADDDAQVDAKREWAGKLAQRASFERAAVQTAREAAEVRICTWPAYAIYIRGGTHRSGCLRAGERETLATPLPLPTQPACSPSTSP